MPQENQRLETRHVGAEKRAFRARLPPILTISTRYQTGWNVTKCHACHAKRHDNLRGNLRKGEPQENQRLETRRVGAPKRAFRARLPPILTLCSLRIDVFLRVFLGTSKFATSKSKFRARLPSIFSTSHKLPHLPRNLHLVATWRSPANAIRKNTQHHTSKVLRLPLKMTLDTSKVLRLPRKLQRIFWKRRKSIAPATQNDFRHVTKHVWMSRSATPAPRNEATRSSKPPKMTTYDHLCRTYHWHGNNGCGRLRTVVDGCGRLRPQTQRRANTPSTPRPPEWNGNPCYPFGKNKTCHGWSAALRNIQHLFWSIGFSLTNRCCLGEQWDEKFAGPGVAESQWYCLCMFISIRKPTSIHSWQGTTYD